MRRSRMWIACLALVACVPANAGSEPLDSFAAPDPVRPELASEFTLAASTITAPSEPRAKKKKDDHEKTRPAGRNEGGLPLGAERSRILLRSLTIPGWGQATLGRTRSAAVFAIAEAGIWGAFTSFRIQEKLRRDTYVRTAGLFAGVNLKGRDEEFLRIVGSFASSDEYNLLVVSRDAANIYLSDPYDPDLVGYRQYIAEHSLGGRDAWSWSDEASFRRYVSQRKEAQRAALRANTTLAFAVANRLISALHAARSSGGAAGAQPRSWNLECVPVPDADPTAFRFGVRTRF